MNRPRPSHSAGPAARLRGRCSEGIGSAHSPHDEAADRAGAGVTNADADRIEGVFASWWTNTYRANISSNCSLILIVLDALDAINGLHREYTTGWTVAGGNATVALPGGTTTAVKHATGVRGRSFRGRSYVVGLAQNDVASGLVVVARRDAIQAAFNTLRTNLAADAAGDQLVVVSFMENGVWRAQGVATPVVSSSAHQNVDSQRRRLIGRGL